MNIALDGNEANVSNRVGSGEYSYRLLNYWAKKASPKREYDIYLRDEIVTDLPESTPSWRYHVIAPKKAWTRFSLPLSLFAHRNSHNVFFNPAHYLPPVTFCPSVVTIHDLAYEFFSDLFLPVDLYKLKNWTKQSVVRASKIIAVSNATKQDLIKVYGASPSDIEVVYNGFDETTFNTKGVVKRDILTIHGLQAHNYLLFVGTIQPRKNLIRLVQAFQLLKEGGYKGKLVIAGKIGWMAEETLSVIKNSKFASEIVLTGYISLSSQKTLYRYADVFVLPSLYEGFGVPVLEAMASGAPVAAADNSSLPEVVGEAGLLFNGADPSALKETILELKKNRTQWVKKGLARAKDFSWDKCARETHKVLISVAKPGK